MEDKSLSEIVKETENQPTTSCNHNFKFLETIKHKYAEDYYYGCWHYKFLRIDKYYCTKCLEQKEIKKSSCDCSSVPEWY